MLSVRQLSNYLFGTYNTIDKIAFFINEEYIFDHYHNIMESLPNDTFDIILADKFQSPSYIPVVNGLKQNGWNVRFLNDVMFIDRYKCLLTHLYLGGNTTHFGTILSRCLAIFLQGLNKILSFSPIKQRVPIKKPYFQNILGHFNIRFMYGADAGKNSFMEYNNNYNELYDMFFCHGPRDADLTKELFDKPIYQMGYPRYDGYFTHIGNSSEKERLLEHYSCDPNKKTILWICTVNVNFSTIETYTPAMKQFLNGFNIIVRPHPLEIDPQYSRFNQKVFDIVKSGIFILNDNAYQDMTELYLISDFVVCDYGGSIFSAMYMDKRIILLNHKNVYKDTVVSTSTSMEAREYLPSIDEDETDQLAYCFYNQEFWSEADEKRERARHLFFGDSRGGSAEKAARYLLAILKGE